MPFNGSSDGGANNPAVANEFRIVYLCSDIGARKAALSREIVLDILYGFVLMGEVEQPNGQVNRLTIWSPYQQLDAVQMLIQDAKHNSARQNYPFQHSAGSGKSSTIA
ncbi:hypothetical protein [Pseudorhodobacter sp.]|uniref:hypothetical protein n=1 Tax=Pseudorhodobacter sp. TaxID=1934400 RepID=UPI0026495F79|nr:hypothetical protein [Pseudorhodobacter sp.]MDN5785692.1 hypothetical protein [Pseudorhodobacter sp.]